MLVLLRSSNGPLIVGLLAPRSCSMSFYGLLIVVTSPVGPKESIDSLIGPMALIIKFLMCE